jgi:hypothetical protein
MILIAFSVAFFIVCVLASRYEYPLPFPVSTINTESWRPVHGSNDLDFCTSVVLDPRHILCCPIRPMKLMHTSRAIDIPYTSVMITFSMHMYLFDYLSQHGNWRLQSRSHHVVQLWTYAAEGIVCRFITSAVQLWHP